MGQGMPGCRMESLLALCPLVLPVRCVLSTRGPAVFGIKRCIKTRFPCKKTCEPIQLPPDQQLKDAGCFRVGEKAQSGLFCFPSVGSVSAETGVSLPRGRCVSRKRGDDSCLDFSREIMPLAAQGKQGHGWI